MQDNKVLTGKIIPTFFSFTMPVILGMVALSSASIVDGIFIGRYVGSDALAAVTLCAPFFSAIFGFTVLFSTGGEVFCGKFIGEKAYLKASNIFTKIIITIAISSIVMSGIGLALVYPAATLLGAGNDTIEFVVEYLRIIITYAPVIAVSYSLTYFVRVDGRPSLSSASLTATAILNIVLDYVFIVQLDWGIKGAAWGTCLSYMTVPFFLIPHFYLKRGNLRFVKPVMAWKTLGQVAYNGSSEFLSEISGGVLFFIINRTVMKFYSTDGVAAYAVVGYLMFIMAMICYATSDSIKSIISINYGAGKIKRISRFLRTALVFITLFGVVLVIFLKTNSSMLIKLFLEDGDVDVFHLAEEFVNYVYPVLLFIGANIILSAYFTALHKAKESLIVSISRTFALPVTLIILLTLFIGEKGVFIALVAAEILTLFIAVGLLKRIKKQSV